MRCSAPYPRAFLFLAAHLARSSRLGRCSRQKGLFADQVGAPQRRQQRSQLTASPSYGAFVAIPPHNWNPLECRQIRQHLRERKMRWRGVAWVQALKFCCFVGHAFCAKSILLPRRNLRSLAQAQGLSGFAWRLSKPNARRAVGGRSAFRGPNLAQTPRNPPAQPCGPDSARRRPTRMVAGVRGRRSPPAPAAWMASQAKGRGFEPRRPLHERPAPARFSFTRVGT
jgi:hypothetical protein